MPPTTRKTLLISGLGPYVPASLIPDKSNVHLVKEEMARADKLGFDCTKFDMNPDDIPSTMASLREMLRGQHWDGICIGWGVRGLKEFTELFEAAINVAVEEGSEGMKFFFTTRPDGVVEAALRVFPEYA